jgi:hypothetical protein
VLANLDANQIKASALQTLSKQRNVSPPIEERHLSAKEVAAAQSCCGWVLGVKKFEERASDDRQTGKPL